MRLTAGSTWGLGAPWARGASGVGGAGGTVDGARGAGWGHVGLGGAYVTNYPSLLPRVGETHYKRGNSAHPSRHSSLIRPAGHDQGDYPHPRGINSE